MIKRITLFSILLFLSCVVAAQKAVTNQTLYWLRYYNQLALNNKWTWHNEIEDRRFFEHNRQHHFIVHSRLHYAFFKNADAAIGFTYSLQSPHDPDAANVLVVPENRIVQELNLRNPLTTRLTLHQRLRIDERFIHKTDGKELIDGYDFNVRFRYRLQATYKVSRPDAKNPITLKLSDELMVNTGKNILYNQFDQNRIYVGIEQRLYKGISLEIGYLHWYQQRASGNQFFDRDIIRLTLSHQIEL